jgi:hypothetical protein
MNEQNYESLVLLHSSSMGKKSKIQEILMNLELYSKLRSSKTPRNQEEKRYTSMLILNYLSIIRSLVSVGININLPLVIIWTRSSIFMIIMAVISTSTSQLKQLLIS